MKNKKDIIYYGVLILIVLAMVLWEIYKPKPTDWTFYLEQEKNDPYGTLVLYETLDDIFPGQNIRADDRSLYERSYSDFPLENNLIFISDEFAPEEEEARMLLNYADEGNHIFIAAHSLSEFLESELKLKITPTLSLFDDTVRLSFVNKSLTKTEPYKFGKTYDARFFNFDYEEDVFSEITEEERKEFKILSTNESGEAVFIRRQWGEGAFYIHLLPQTFTNFAMITQKNYEYAYSCLSYLPANHDVVWDEYYKPVKPENYTHLKYVRKNPALRHGYQIVIGLLILYTIFTAKRKQRIIPVIKPLKNTTLEFAETVGRLYYHSKNNKNIALKKYNFWQEHLRQFFYVNNEDILLDNIERLSEKTGASENTIRNIILNRTNIETHSQISDQFLKQFTTYIEDYYEQEK